MKHQQQQHQLNSRQVRMGVLQIQTCTRLGRGSKVVAFVSSDGGDALLSLLLLPERYMTINPGLHRLRGAHNVCGVTLRGVMRLTMSESRRSPKWNVIRSGFCGMHAATTILLNYYRRHADQREVGLPTELGG